MGSGSVPKDVRQLEVDREKIRIQLVALLALGVSRCDQMQLEVKGANLIATFRGLDADFLEKVEQGAESGFDSLSDNV